MRDETGATIRGAIVRAETGGTGTSAAPVTLTTATDDRGRFVFVVIRSGEWRLTFEAPGFDPMTIPLGVRLGGAAPNLDVKLERRESPEAFGALAGVDSKSLSAQLAAAAVLYDEGRHDQAIAAYREIKARAPALSLVNLQIGNSLPGEEVVRRSRSRLSGSAEERRGGCERAVCDGSAEGSAGKCGRSAELVPESLGRRRGLDSAADETGGARQRRRRSRRGVAPSDARHRARPRVAGRPAGGGVVEAVR